MNDLHARAKQLMKEMLFTSLTRREKVAAIESALREQIEACAKVCESLSFTSQGPDPIAKRQRDLCAAAIRGLKE